MYMSIIINKSVDELPRERDFCSIWGEYFSWREYSLKVLSKNASNHAFPAQALNHMRILRFAPIRQESVIVYSWLLSHRFAMQVKWGIIALWVFSGIANVFLIITSSWKLQLPTRYNKNKFWHIDCLFLPDTSRYWHLDFRFCVLLSLKVYKITAEQRLRYC